MFAFFPVFTSENKIYEYKCPQMTFVYSQGYIYIHKSACQSAGSDTLLGFHEKQTNKKQLRECLATTLALTDWQTCFHLAMSIEFSNIPSVITMPESTNQAILNVGKASSSRCDYPSLYFHCYGAVRQIHFRKLSFLALLALLTF